MPYLIPSRHFVTVLTTCLETAVRTGLVLQVDQTATVSLALNVGSHGTSARYRNDRNVAYPSPNAKSAGRKSWKPPRIFC